jgi:N-acetylneuraminate synthase
METCQFASLEPSSFRQLVGAVRKIEVAMGDGIKRVIKDETPIAKNLRQRLINLKDNNEIKT